MQNQLLATFVVDSHIKHHPSNDEIIEDSQPTSAAEILQDLLRKYIVYSKENV